GKHHDSMIPRWGPFGRKILYLHGRYADDVWLMDADGTHNHRLHDFKNTRNIHDMAWAPGGRRIALVMDATGVGTAYDEFIYTPRTGTLRRLHVNSVDRFPRFVDWSPDGS